MKLTKTKQLIIVFLFLLPAMLLTVILQNNVAAWKAEAQKVPYQLEKKDLYNQYGLEGNKELSANKLLEDEELVVYHDRIFKINQINPENALLAADISANMKSRIPGIEAFYLMPIPERAPFENGYEKEGDSYNLFVDRLRSSASSGVEVLDVFPKLKAHSQEYIYYRTRNSWTMRGAFYGAQVLRRALGYEEELLGEYRSYVFGKTNSELRTYVTKKYPQAPWIDKVENIEEDPSYIYIKGSNPNREVLTYKKRTGAENTLKRPTIQLNSLGNDAIIGMDYFHSVVEGSGEGAILFICDRRGKLLVPYLSDSYELAYVVNIYSDDSFHSDMERIVGEYNIKNIVWAQSVTEMGDNSYMRALNPFIQMENIR